MTDIEKLVEWLGCTPAHEMGCSWWRSDRKSLQGRCDCGLTEARELAARVAEELEWLESLSNRLGGRVQELKEELEEAQQLEPNIQRQVKIITGLEMANATLRAKVEELEKQIRHRCKNGIGEDARCILIQGHDGNCHLIHRDSYSGWHSEPTTDEGEE